MVNKMNAVLALKDYALRNSLIEKNEQIWAVNVLLDVLKSDSLPNIEIHEGAALHEILGALCDDAYERGVLMEASTFYRDLFDTELMGRLTPRPSQIISSFEALRVKNVEEATKWFYQLNQHTNYLRLDRIAEGMQWKTKTEYGVLDISINPSKPEKDPLIIAAARNHPSLDYPRCQLCPENEGYAGRIKYPARQNHRMIPITLNGSSWFFQFSPYVYYNEHCICLTKEHVPLEINRKCFANLLDFVKQFPHYFAGSNADLPIVGGSILSHDHFHGGRYSFALEKAPLETELSIHGFEDIKVGIVKWPMSVIRLACSDASRLLDLADCILNVWRHYTDTDAMIFAETNGELHNTITPVARKRYGVFELDLVLRNNLTTPENPLGLYHSHADKHHIKKENIGVIEAMGMALLPARLKKELVAVVNAIITGKNLHEDPLTEKHAEWAEAIQKAHSINSENAFNIVLEETGKVFVAALEDAGVFKRNIAGKTAFLKFLSNVI